MPRSVAAALSIFLAALVWTAASGARAQDQAAEDPAADESPLTEVDRFGQPLAFSHAIHVGQFNMECQYCHVYARRGPVAGIPSVQRCAECHFVIANDRPEIARLMEYWNAGEPIPWVRIHRLPDYARFNHQRHIQAGLTCESCHGDVSQMDAAVQVAPLTMGWCLTCHDDQQAPRDCLVCHY